jgi:hypothetical protein
VVVAASGWDMRNLERKGSGGFLGVAGLMLKCNMGSRKLSQIKIKSYTYVWHTHSSL